MVVPPARGRGRAPSGGRLGFAAGAESARELSELGRSVSSLARLAAALRAGRHADRPGAAPCPAAGDEPGGFFPYAQVEGLPGIVLYGLVVSLAGVMLIVAVALASESHVPAVAGRDRPLRANVVVFAATPVVGFLVGLVFDGFRRLSLPVVVVPLVAAVVAFWTMRTPVVAAPRVSFGEVVRLTVRSR